MPRFVPTRSLVLAFALSLLLPVSARAIPVDDLENWTRTVWTSSGGLQSFEFDPDSNWEIVDFDPDTPQIEDPRVLTEDILTGSPTDPVDVGTLISITIPNFFDPLPRKTVQIEITGGNPEPGGLERAFVIDIVGGDADFDQGGPSRPVFGVLESTQGTPGDGFVVREVWGMTPNPDHETVTIFAPRDFDLQTIEIVTESIGEVPAPPAAALVGLALAGVLARRRHRTT